MPVTGILVACLLGCLGLRSEQLESLRDRDGDGYFGTGADCNDDRADIHPGALESCNEADDDCDGVVDEAATDASLLFVDLDGDGFGGSTTVLACDYVAGYVSEGGDCNDADDGVNPGATEVCNTGVSESCGVDTLDCLLQGEHSADDVGVLQPLVSVANVSQGVWPIENGGGVTVGSNGADGMAFLCRYSHTVPFCVTIQATLLALSGSPTDEVFLAAWDDGHVTVADLDSPADLGVVDSRLVVGPFESGLAKLGAYPNLRRTGADEVLIPSGDRLHRLSTATEGLVSPSDLDFAYLPSAADPWKFETSCDFNGDGSVDLGMSDPSAKEDEGTVWVSLEVDPFSTQWFTNGNEILGGSSVGLGYDVSCGDLNGDGRGDLLVGTTLGVAGLGEVYVILGSDIDTGAFDVDEVAYATFASDTVGDWYGVAVDVGDFSGDGSPDLTVGAPLRNPKTSGGAIFIGYGPVTEGLYSSPMVTGPPSSHLGASLGLAHLNDDAFADLYVLAPGYLDDGTVTGAIFLMWGQGL